MNGLHEALDDYLSLRRSLGYKLERAEKLLGQFLSYLDSQGAEFVTVEHALAWARLPADGGPNWWANRLLAVRGFAAHLATIDPRTEVPAADLLPWRKRRRTPYLYTDAEIIALLAAAVRLRPQFRVATYQTLFGLLAVTGMRVGEAIRLDRDDYDRSNGSITVRAAKFGKTRQIPLHPSTAEALTAYLARTDRPRPPAGPALFVTPVGTRLLYCNVHSTFTALVRHAGIHPRSAACQPRIHALRHTFAVNTLLDAYRDGVDVGQRLALLSTYLGHVDPAGTYWYLTASPELLALAAIRLDQPKGDRP